MLQFNDEINIRFCFLSLLFCFNNRLRSSDLIGEEVYTESLMKNTTPFITTQVSSHHAKRKIGESTKTPIEFFAKYDELKAIK